MTDPAVLWLSGFCTGVAMSGWAFNRTPRDRDPDWRRSFTHENTKRPSGAPPLKLRRSTDGYQPRPQQGTPNPPPSEP
jgi:hypothetical protein